MGVRSGREKHLPGKTPKTAPPGQDLNVVNAATKVDPRAMAGPGSRYPEGDGPAQEHIFHMLPLDLGNRTPLPLGRRPSGKASNPCATLALSRAVPTGLQALLSRFLRPRRSWHDPNGLPLWSSAPQKGRASHKVVLVRGAIDAARSTSQRAGARDSVRPASPPRCCPAFAPSPTKAGPLNHTADGWVPANSQLLVPK